MKYYFCLLSTEEALVPTNIGLNYALTKRASWIEIASSGASDAFVNDGNKGHYFAYHDGKSYMLQKRYINLDDKYIVIICTESKAGCDTITSF